MPWTNYLSLDNLLFLEHQAILARSQHYKSHQNLKRTIIAPEGPSLSACIHYSLLSECLIYWEESFPRHSTVVSIPKTLKSTNRIKGRSVFTNLPFHLLLSWVSQTSRPRLWFSSSSCSIFQPTTVSCQAIWEHREKRKISNMNSVFITNVDVLFIIDFSVLIFFLEIPH